MARYLLGLCWVWGHGDCYVEVWLREIVDGGVVERVTEWQKLEKGVIDNFILFFV